MSLRPREHQLEDESRIEFQRVLPKSWVFRSETPDYGVDAHIEIFDSEANSTGYRFFVQLKATDSPNPKSAQSIRVYRKSARYLSSLDLPVLMASYHSATRSFYVRWFHEYDSRNNPGDTDTITFKFEDTHLWTDNTPTRLQESLVLIRTFKTGGLVQPLTMSINFEEDGVGGLTKAQIVSGIQDLLDLMPGAFSFEEGTHTNGVVQFLLDHRGARIDLARSKFGFLHIEDVNPSPTTFVSDIFMLLAILFGQAGYVELTAKIALTVASSSSIIKDPKVFMGLASMLTRGQRVQDALAISEELIKKHGPDWTSAFLAFPALGSTDTMNPYELQFFERYLLGRIAFAKEGADRRSLAIAHYNFANFARTHCGHEIALYHYQRARKNDSEYAGRGYFRAELAGVLFELGRFSLSARLYETCIGNTERSDVKALYADALMFSGQYSMAKEKFDEYLRERLLIDKFNAEWHLKLSVLNYIMDTFGIKSQKRRSQFATNVAGRGEEWVKRGINLLKEALESDALCGLAWFNWGVTENRLGHFENAAMAFTVTSVCQKWDVESWANAWSLTMRIGQHRLSGLILIAGYKANGTRFIDRCTQMVEEAKRPELKVVMRKGLEECFKETKERSGAIVRVLGSGDDRTVYEINAKGGLTLRKLSP